MHRYIQNVKITIEIEKYGQQKYKILLGFVKCWRDGAKFVLIHVRKRIFANLIQFNANPSCRPFYLSYSFRVVLPRLRKQWNN